MKRRRRRHQKEEEQRGGEERGVQQDQPQRECHTEKVQPALDHRYAAEVVEAEGRLERAVRLRRRGQQRHLDRLGVTSLRNAHLDVVVVLGDEGSGGALHGLVECAEGVEIEGEEGEQCGEDGGEHAARVHVIV